MASLEDGLAQAQAALATAPDSWRALAAVGSLLAALGRLEAAVPFLERAFALGPNQATVANNLGAAYRALGRLSEGRELFRRAAALEPSYADAVANLAGSYSAVGAHEEAAAALEGLIAEGVDSAGMRDQLAMALWAAGRAPEAITHLERAIALDPRHAGAYAHLGQIHVESGSLPEAKWAYLKAIEIAPERPEYYRFLIEVDAEALEPHHLASLSSMRPDDLSIDDRIERDFALARAAMRTRDTSVAFQHFAAANAAARSQRAYEERQTLDAFIGISETFTQSFIAAREGTGDPSELPVFVFGMPRSGTTLIEQMLASHPDVAGGGELGLFEDVVQEREGPRELREIGAAYAAALRAIAPGALRVTDKMPANFRYAGFIHLALPNARMIHVRRDPIDTCFSCFTQHFRSEGLAWTYDLGEIGRYYRGYFELMEHWRRTLPNGAILEVQYEDLVDDFETQARRIVAYCGLTWNDTCLTFHQTKRAVKTASVAQVRRPLYRSSIGYSRPFVPYLSPLLDALGPTRARSKSNWLRST